MRNRMAELLRLLSESYGYLFLPDGYHFVDSAVNGASGGSARVVLESANTRMVFSNAGGEMLLQFRPLRQLSVSWYSLGLLKGALSPDYQGESEVLNPGWAAFLGEHLRDLERAFSTLETDNELIRGMEYQRHLRVQRLKGQEFWV